ncbi:hemin uptake protein HemP [Rhodovulum strictum]|uniref:Hemin uptake protein HemP n=2 Tax=Rhodovulum strictum TaxID=58314 RepID=A0A844B6Z8_9RHOB|nr:hemin uptake protein HemP [Rhodovulum strictum]
MAQAEQPRGTAEGREGGAAKAPEHDARRLTAGGPSAVIRLNGMDYQLRITRAGKLILTK